MADINLRDAHRRMLAEPSDENITSYIAEAIRSGMFSIQQHADRRYIKMMRTAAMTHVVAERLRHDDSAFYTHFPQWQEAKNTYKLKRLLARAVYGGLPQEDLKLLLSYERYDLPIGVWGPGGEGLDEVCDPLSYNFSHRGEEFVEIFIAYEDLNTKEFNTNQFSVDLVDLIYQAEMSNEGDRLIDYQGHIYRGFTADNVDDEIIEEIVESLRGSHPVIAENTIREALTDPMGLAQVAFDFRHQYGAGEIDYDPLAISSVAEMRRQLALELAMDFRRWLK